MNKKLLMRSLLALALMAGFYVLALGLALGLMALPVLEYVVTGRFHSALLQIHVLAILAGCIILWSIFPRHQRFQAPGPRLNLADHPRLQQALQDIATKTAQRMPDEVYLLLDNNAWVQETNVLFGLYHRRRMALGLPLMHSLTEEEFKAVLAHEYGHYQSGDTRLGAFIYGTRAAIIRTVQSLGDSWLHWPFRWYGNLYLKITHGISRQQEYDADRLAAQVTHPLVMVRALEKVSRYGALFDVYWRNEVVPVLNSGYRPPILRGYGQYLTSRDITRYMQNRPTQPEENEDPYDTHPSFGKRVAALEALPRDDRMDTSGMALELLHQPETLEWHFLEYMGGRQAQELRRIEWHGVGEGVWINIWKEQVAPHQGVFRGLTFRTLIDRLQVHTERFALIRSLRDPQHPEEDDLAWHVLRVQVLLSLHGQGWEVSALPGDRVTCTRSGFLFAPFEDVAHLRSGELSPADWLQRLEQGGVQLDRFLV